MNTAGSSPRARIMVRGVQYQKSIILDSLYLLLLGRRQDS